jgi:hypothetical protein
VAAGYAAVVTITAWATFPNRVDTVAQRAVAQPENYSEFYKRIYAPPPQADAPAAAVSAEGESCIARLTRYRFS